MSNGAGRWLVSGLGVFEFLFGGSHKTGSTGKNRASNIAKNRARATYGVNTSNNSKIFSSVPQKSNEQRAIDSYKEATRYSGADKYKF